MSTFLDNEHKIVQIEAGDTVVLNRRIHHKAIKYASEKNIGFYCGRGTIYGNKYVMKDESERDKVVRAYWLDIKHGRTHLKEKDFRVLIGKALVFWCTPLRCHCDALKFVADKLRDGHTFDEIKQM